MTHDDSQEIEKLAIELERVHQAMMESRPQVDDETRSVQRPVHEGSEHGDNSKKEIESLTELLKLLESIRPSSPSADAVEPSEAKQGGPNPSSKYPKLNRYEIIRPLGQGGYGAVFLAKEINLNREVALKFPKLETLLTEELKNRFVHEARAVSRLNHPNIVAVFEAGIDAGIYFIATEFVDGGSLSEWLDSSEEIPVGTAAEIVEILAGAMAHAHRRGVIHRDLKPSNILLEKSQDGVRYSQLKSRLKITDFGLAKMDANPQQTGTGALVGTPSYMSPEQTRGRSADVGPPSDVYALGTILYRLLKGELPFERDSIMDTLRAVQEEEPAPIRTKRTNVPRDLETICMKCLNKTPSERYASAFDLADDLRRWKDGFPIHARPVTAWERVVRWANRNPVLALVSAGFALALIIGTIVSTSLWYSANYHLGRSMERQSELRQSSVQLKNAIDQLFYKLATSPELRNENAIGLRETLLEEANRYYVQFLQTAPQDDSARLNYAQSLLGLGEINLLLGEFVSASKLGEMTLNELETLNSGLGDSESKDIAIVKTYLFLSQSYHEAGQFDKSFEQFKLAQERLDHFDEGNSNAELQSKLLIRKATILLAQDKIEEAGEAINQLELYWDLQLANHGDLIAGLPDYHLTQANSLFIQGESKRLHGSQREAVLHYQDSLKICRDTLAWQPDSVTWSELYSRCSRGCGISNAIQGRFVEAKKCYQGGIVKAEKLVARHPSTERFADLQKRLFYSLAATEMSLGNYAAVESCLLKQIDLVDKMLASWPESEADLLSGLGDSYNLLFAAYDRWEDATAEQAQDALGKSLTCFEKAIRLRPDWSRPKMALARAKSNMGNVEHRKGDFDKASEWYLQAYEDNQRLLNSQPNWNEALRSQFYVVSVMTKNFEANNQLNQAAKYSEDMIQAYPTHPLSAELNRSRIWFVAKSGDVESAWHQLRELEVGSDHIETARLALKILDLEPVNEDTAPSAEHRDWTLATLKSGLPDDPLKRDSYLKEVSNDEQLKVFRSQLED